MKTMHQNSVMAFHTIVKPELTKRQVEVMLIYESGEKYTDEQVAKLLDKGINQISGRVGELLKKGHIIEVGNDYSTGRGRRLCQIAKKTLF